MGDRLISAARIHGILRALPVRGLAAGLGAGPILILAPHPDDETLGCGGLIAEACATGLYVSVLVLTDGAGSHPNSRHYPAARLRRVREAESRDAARALGLAGGNIGFLGLPDTHAPRTGEAAHRAVDGIAEHATRIGAQIILTTWRHDPHADHVSASLLGGAASRRLGLRLFEYPVWGWTLPPRRLLRPGSIQGFRLDVRAHLGAKRRAIGCHRSQLGQVVDDDPAGFTMAPQFIARFTGQFETFIEVGETATESVPSML